MSGAQLTVCSKQAHRPSICAGLIMVYYSKEDMATDKNWHPNMFSTLKHQTSSQVIDTQSLTNFQTLIRVESRPNGNTCFAKNYHCLSTFCYCLKDCLQQATYVPSFYILCIWYLTQPDTIPAVSSCSACAPIVHCRIFAKFSSFLPATYFHGILF